MLTEEFEKQFTCLGENTGTQNLYSFNRKVYKLQEKSKVELLNTYKHSNHDNSNFISLLWKGVYPYEYVDDWEKSNETSLCEKEAFYSLKCGGYYWSRLCACKKRL